MFKAKCPVCSSEGVLPETTEMRGVSEEDISLDFDADGFACSECGLV